MPLGAWLHGELGKAMMMKHLPAAILCSLGAFSAPAFAGDITGAEKLICAPIVAVECEAFGDCGKGTAESINVPQFFRVDIGQKLIAGEDAGGDRRTSTISNVIRNDGALILQGAQLGRGWSANINMKTGKMVVTASAGDIAIILFGSCIAE